MTDDHTTDRRLATALTRIDVDIPLGEAAADRVMDRMLGRYDAEVADALPGAVVLDLADEHASGTHRSGVWLARAAAVILAVGAVTAISLSIRSDDDGRDVTDRPPATTEPAPSPTVNALGFDAFAGYLYGAIESDSRSEGFETGLTIRTGGWTSERDGTYRLPIRRGLIGSNTGVTTFDLIVRARGVVDVPLEFLDPPELGGRCSGGTVTIDPDESPSTESWSSATTAICDGVPVEVAIVETAGDPQDLPLLTEPVRATPVTYVITPSGQQPRTVVLWFGEHGLVRHTVNVIGTDRNLDLSPDGLVTMEES